MNSISAPQGLSDASLPGLPRSRTDPANENDRMLQHPHRSLSALQTGLFASSISQPGTWIGSHVFPIPVSADLPRFKAAWSTVVQQNEILRSRIVWRDDAEVEAGATGGMRLVILDEEELQWEEHTMEGKEALALIIGQLRSRDMGLGQKLSAFTILTVLNGSGPVYKFFIWTMHHAIYDNSHLFVLQDVLQIYHQQTSPPLLPRPSFVTQFLDKHVSKVDYGAASTFWTEELAGCDSIAIFPSLPKSFSSSAHPQTRIETPFSFPAPKRTIVADATNSTLIRAAWAIVIAKHTATKDVVFGSTVAGRYDTETKDIVGPTFATVPVRVTLDGERKTLAQHLEKLQRDAANARDHEQVGLQFIQNLGPSTRRASSFQNLLVIQPKNHPTPAPVTNAIDYPSAQNIEKLDFTKTHLDLMQTYGLVMEVTPSSSGSWLLVAKYDDRLLSATAVERICNHFAKAIHEVFSNENRDVELDHIDLLTSMDLEAIEDLFFDSSVEQDLPDNNYAETLQCEFENRARCQPDSVAIDAWDASLTYAELNTLSTNLAHQIYHNYIHKPSSSASTSSIIPICFSKSAYAIVAMLAILKTGRAYLPLDTGWPGERIKAVLHSVYGMEEAPLDLILCDDDQKARFEAGSFTSQSQCRKILAVNKSFIKDLGSSPGTPTLLTPLPSISSSDLAYIIFTSGSTGLPKGIAISHNACATNFQSRLSFLPSYTSATRVLQFASFAFDVSVFDIFGTLSAGACVVIPHESFRINPSRLSQFMTEKRVSWASLSPTFATYLNPEDVPTLKTLIFGGELLTTETIQRWKSPGFDVRLGNELGPSETCIACVGNYNVELDTDARDLGRPIGGNKLFLVDKDNVSKLVPVGCIGELVVYGESVMDEYLGDKLKTAEVFVELPEQCKRWLPQAEHRRAFRTGDLFTLNEGGNLMYVGRRDQQLKLRGFRMEAGEIEECIKLHDDINGAVVELMNFQDQAQKLSTANEGQELVAFFSFKGTSSLSSYASELPASEASIISPSSNSEILILIRQIKACVRNALPQYMEPSLYVPISHIPMTRSGKQDRNQLRRLLNDATSKTLEGLRGLAHIDPGSADRVNGSHGTAGDSSLSPTEHGLKTLWIKVLGHSHYHDIGYDSNFFHLGGNSIKAIQLSVLALKTGFRNLDVAEIYESPTLRDMAQSCLITDKPGLQGGIPSNVTEDNVTREVNNETNEVSKQQLCTTLGLDPMDIEDIYSCTPLQEGLLAVSIRQPGTYVVARIWSLDREINTHAFRDAWELTIERNEILRTRIAEDDERFWQVVFARNCNLGFRHNVEERDIAEFDLRTENEISARRLNQDQTQGGRRLSFFEILKVPTTGESYFKWTIHHAVYDAWVLSMIWEQVRNNYRSVPTQQSVSLPQEPRINFANFVRKTYPLDIPSASQVFWQTYLSAPEPWPSFPAISKSITSIPQTDSVISRHFDLKIHTIPGVTEASLIRAAWAWVQSLYLGVDDVVFGVTLSGRSAPGASHVVGPTITTVPVRVAVDQSMQIIEFLKRAQADASAMIRHEHTGLSNIRTLSESAGWACEFANILVVQDDRGQTGLAWDGVQAVSVDTDIKHSIPLVLECVLEDGGLKINAIFSTKFIGRADVEFLLAHFGRAIESLSEAALSHASLENKVLSDIDFFSEEDGAWIKSWNHERKASTNRLIHEVFRGRAEQCRAKSAIDAWDVHFTYEELNEASDVLARKLVGDHQVGPGVLVAVSFEKSGWAVLAMLAIWKAGGGFVPLDTSQPKSRLEDIVSTTQLTTALCSPNRLQQLEDLVPGAVLALNDQYLKLILSSVRSAGKNAELSSSTPLTNVTPQDVCYVLFTSGSTGRPKGVVLEHASVCTSLLGLADTMRVEPSSRVLQFASYAFDASIGEIFTALLVGSTLCVPSERQRMDFLTEFIIEKSVNWIWLTPTVAGFLDPRDLPEVKSIITGGEAASTKMFQAWIGNGTTVIYGYGPTETSITVTFNVNVTVDTDPANIGIPICASTWVVDPLEPSRLLPVGCVGELVISGPIVGRGYLDPLKTAMAFGEIPDTWEILVGRDQRIDQPRERFYRTGDLVRYDTAGNVLFIGRKDAQVKLHGQRIELTEITNRIDEILGDRCSSIVEKFEISKQDSSGGNSESVLVAMFTVPEFEVDDSKNFHSSDDVGLFHTPSPATSNLINDMETKLETVLPLYMIPKIFVPLRFVPTTTTGKVDRNRLKREVLDAIRDSGRGRFMPDRDRVKEQPRNNIENRLQEIWSSVLELSTERIGIHDSFLRLGGDSLKAISLGRAARRAGLYLSVADIFLHPILSDMAVFVQSGTVGVEDQGGEASQISAFSMVSDDVGDVKRHASVECAISLEDVEDVYPCTAMQVGMVVASYLDEHSDDQTPNLYALRRRILFDSPSAAVNFVAAWETVTRRMPILRTRIIRYQSKFYQVVVKGGAASSYRMPGSITGLTGRPLAELKIGPSNECEISLHHSIYDAVLLPHLLEEIKREFLSYSSGPTIPHSKSSRMIPFRNFIQHLQARDENAASVFWTRYLSSTANTISTIAQGTFPPTSQHSDGRSSTKEIYRNFTGEAIQNKTHSGITLANVINSAWAIVVGRHTGAHVVIFGNTVSGRDALLEEGVIEGPTMATVPLRFEISDDQPVVELINRAQHDAAEIRRYQHLGMAKIAKLGDSKFHTLLVVQTATDTVSGDDDVISATLESLPGIRGISGHHVAQQEYPLVLECLINSTDLIGVRAYYDERVVELSDVVHLLAHFEQAIRTLVEPSKQDIQTGDIDLITDTDLSTLRDWNPKPREGYGGTLLDLFLQNVKENSENEALYSTEIGLSYGELDRYSNHAARYISEKMRHHSRDTQSPFTIAMCFEKSAWAVVTILAIMKIGAAYVPLDPSSPDSRLKMILDDVKSSAIVCSAKQAKRFTSIAATSTIILFDDRVQNSTYTDIDEDSNSGRGTITAESLAYILFTSGSTGRPKGVLVPHGAIGTSILAFSPVIKLSGNSRVLQFSSFGFDASVGEIFATLSVGGCICLPNDDERLGNVSKFMNESRVNWAFLTPVTLRIITPDEVPLLRVLVVGGEPLPPSLFKTWAARPDTLQLMEAYGPTECCVFSTMNTTVTPDTHPQDIGLPLGGATWIVDPHDYNKLTPVGCVGELVISGKTVAAGYYAVSKVSTTGFIEQAPKWAPLFPEHAISRIYGTGDLARFKADGSIHYVARKDNQVNLRGIRMELGEIEYHLARSAAGDKAAPIVVITNIPTQGKSESQKAALVCFFVVELGGKIQPEPLRMSKQRKLTVQSIVSYLEGKVPLYMIPRLFIPMSCFPENTSGKVERKALIQDILGDFEEDDFKHYSISITTQVEDSARPLTEVEQTLQKVWSQLLNVEINIIKHNDNFLRLGGDSVDMIRMVTILHQQGWQLSPVEAMADPTLSSIASKITSVGTASSIAMSRISPFSLLMSSLGASGTAKLVESAAKQCGVSEKTIEDIYPATALQEGLLSAGEKIPGSYYFRQAWSLDAAVDTGRLIAAYRGLCKAHPILRTRFVYSDEGKLYQVVIQDDFKSFSDSEVQANAIPRVSGGLSGKRLHHIAIHAAATATDPSSQGPKRFVRTIHHALYDAWSLATLDAELVERYAAVGSFVCSERASYTEFIEYINKAHGSLADEYWRNYLDGARQTSWPPTPRSHQPQTTARAHSTFELEWTKASSAVQNHTKASVARLAWAIILSKYSNDTDVSFGVAVSGRDVPVPGIERMTGPTNATVPFRYQLLDSSDQPSSIADVLDLARNQATQMNKFQHYGLQNIMRINAEAREICNFGTLFVVQPAQQLQKWSDSTSKILQEIPAETSGLVHPYPIVFEICFQSHSSTAEMWIHYDEYLISGTQVDLIVRQLQTVLQALISSEPSTKIDALDLNDQTSMELMKSFHDETFKTPAECDIVSLLGIQTSRSPHSPAIYAWDGTMTYAELDIISSNVGAYLSETVGMTSGSMVPICFEKSIWAIVAMLAVLKSGSAYVPIDPSAPDEYKRVLLDQIASQSQNVLSLVSEGQFETIRRLASPGAQTFAITKSVVASISRLSSPSSEVSPSAVAYILFTSGSTGVPKGVVVEHHAVCASILSHGKACGFDPSTRALQFAAFTFDASIMEIWTTLAFGGCICIPSETQRVNNLEQYITDSKVNWSFLTPTVSSLIRKEMVRTLRTLVLGGEALTLANVQKWTSDHERDDNDDFSLMNGYGPTECVVFTCVNTKVIPASDPQDIGRAIGVSAWIVDPKDYNRLMPLTCPGELVIIGPTLAREYLGDPVKTKQAFVYPQWSRSVIGTESRAYRTGDLASCGLDGHIRILGRIDTQIKLNGMRVETGEIEKVLVSCALDMNYRIEVVVDKLTPIATSDETQPAPSIVAFLSFVDSDNIAVDIASIERELTSRVVSRLHRYMIPTYFIYLRHIPTTTAGKVDRKLLRKLWQDPEAYSSIILHRTSSPLQYIESVLGDARLENEEMQSPSEIILRDLWAEIFRIENANQIMRHDNFLALGGESIRAIRLVAMARERHNMFLTVNIIFRHPLLTDLAKQMSPIVEEVEEDEPFDMLIDEF